VRRTPFQTQENLLRAMNLLPLDVDTREPPTPPYHLTSGEFQGLDFGEQSIGLSSIRTTERDSPITSSNPHTTALPTSSAIKNTVAPPPVQAEHTLGLSGTAVLCIILGGIVGVVLLVFALLFCIKRGKHGNKRKDSLAQALEMRGGVKRTSKVRR
jgi:hypothetical protein